MKKINVLITLLFVVTIATAQKSISEKEDHNRRAMVSAAASSFENSEVSISWTLGNTLFTLSEAISTEISSNIINLNVSIKAFPNPTQDYLIISNKAEKKEALKMLAFDLNRKLLFQKNMTQERTEISLQYLPSALYEIKILNSKNQLVKSFKIIKY